MAQSSEKQSIVSIQRKQKKTRRWRNDAPEMKNKQCVYFCSNWDSSPVSSCLLEFLLWTKYMYVCGEKKDVPLIENKRNETLYPFSWSSELSPSMGNWLLD